MYHRRIRNSVCKGPETTESLLELTFPELFSKPCSIGNSSNRGGGQRHRRKPASVFTLKLKYMQEGRMKKAGNTLGTSVRAVWVQKFLKTSGR